jgi:hypothetical protein
METAAGEVAAAARRRAMPQGQIDESEASATMAAAAVGSKWLARARPSEAQDKEGGGTGCNFREITNRRVGRADCGTVPEGRKREWFLLGFSVLDWSLAVPFETSRFGLGNGGSLAQNISYPFFLEYFLFGSTLIQY